ncbi:hypothetical protein [Streptomyces sp. NPDC002671]
MEVPERPVPEGPESLEVPEIPESPAAPVRRRGRTAWLVAGAAVLGLVAGTCAGYLVQADREPTALPPLSQPTLPQAKGKGPAPLAAAQDRKVKMDGDLRKLLLKKPSGARKGRFDESNDGRLSLAGYAEEFGRPSGAFRELVATEFRRGAVVDWRESDTRYVEIRLIQYRQEETRGAAQAVDTNNNWAEEEGDTRSWPIPGTGDGMAYVHKRSTTVSGVSFYLAEAHAWRGDVAMEIWIFDNKPIPSGKIRDLAKRQMERL